MKRVNLIVLVFVITLLSIGIVGCPMPHWSAITNGADTGNALDDASYKVINK